VLFASPLPSAEALAARYGPDGEWATTHQVRNTVRKDGPLVLELDRVVGLERPPGSAAVLDVGCGGGKWLNTLADRGWQTFGIEPSSKVAFARHREIERVPAAPTFDLIILSHVLEHVRHPGRMLADCARALKPGAWLFVSVPNLDGLPQHRDWYYCLNGRAHLTAYSSAALQALCARVGLAWRGRLSDPQAVVERGKESSRMHALAQKAEAPVQSPSHPLDAALAALHAAEVAGR
jgi:2-polyprenyl-3-methyl-5-hydroxy-6-metoxy-1,4-benzoquinol methylase